MRSGEAGPGAGNPLLACPPALPAPHSPCLHIKPFPRYGGFSLAGRDPDLPSGREVAHTVAEMRALLTPEPGSALDRILNNLTQWALGLDAQSSLKVSWGWEVGAARGPKALCFSALMVLTPLRSGSTTRAGMPWWPL